MEYARSLGSVYTHTELTNEKTLVSISCLKLNMPKKQSKM